MLEVSALPGAELGWLVVCTYFLFAFEVLYRNGQSEFELQMLRALFGFSCIFISICCFRCFNYSL